MSSAINQIKSSIQTAVRSEDAFSGEKGNLASRVQLLTTEGTRSAVEYVISLIKNKGELVSTKIMAIRVLDHLMGARDKLATAVAEKLRFFSDILRKSKEKTPSKRRPEFFPTTTSMVDVEDFVGCVAEFIEKWARQYAARPDKLREFTTTRDKLKKEGVSFPQSQDFHHLSSRPGGSSPSNAPPPPPPPPMDDDHSRDRDRRDSGGGGDASRRSSDRRMSRTDLDIALTMAVDLKEAIQDDRHSDRTRDLLEKCQKELSFWEGRASDAADNDRMDEFEDIADVTHKLGEAIAAYDKEPAPSEGKSERPAGGKKEKGEKKGGTKRSKSPKERKEKKDRDREQEDQPDYLTGDQPDPSSSPLSLAGPSEKGKKKKRRDSTPASHASDAAPDKKGGEGDEFVGVSSSGVGLDEDPFTRSMTPAFGDSVQPAAMSSPVPWTEASFTFQTAPALGAGAAGGQPIAGSEGEPSFGGFQSAGASVPNLTELPPMAPHASPSLSHAPDTVPPDQQQQQQPPGGPMASPGMYLTGPPSVASLVRSEAAAGQQAAMVRQMQMALKNKDGEIEGLQNQIDNLQVEMQKKDTQNQQLVIQLTLASAKIRQLDPLRDKVADLTDKLNDSKGRCEELSDRLHRCSTQLRETMRDKSQVETELSDKEALLSDTRQRLFHERQRCAQLTADIEAMGRLHGSLQERLQTATASQQHTETQLAQLKYIFDTTDGLHIPPALVAPPSPPQHSGAFMSNPFPSRVSSMASSTMLRVGKGDELERTLVSGRSSSSGGGGVVQEREQRMLHFASARVTPQDDADESKAKRRYFSATPNDVWNSTPTVEVSLGSDPMSVKQLALYRNLLLARQGLLYEDKSIEVYFAVDVNACERRGEFELLIENRGRVLIPQMDVKVAKQANRGLSVRLAPLPGGAESGLRPQQRQSQRGSLDVSQPFDDTPVLELTYLSADNCRHVIPLRLPLPMVVFMDPVTMGPSDFFDRWDTHEYEMGELAFVFPLRAIFHAVGGFYYLTKCVSMGGAFSCLPALDSSPQNVVAAGKFGGTECLVRVEQGRGHHMQSKGRVAIRSPSYVINRALKNVFLDMLAEVGVEDPLDRLIEVTEKERPRNTRSFASYESNHPLTTSVRGGDAGAGREKRAK